ncbi:HK97-gp10 family putative phage morphogenesis protein, partial [Escherichia sp. SP-MK]
LLGATSEIAFRIGSPPAARSGSPKKATKSEPWRTGQHWADNIRVTKAKMEGGIKTIKIGIDKADRSPYFYGKFLEWGTSKMPAQPFIEPGFHSSKEVAIRAMTAIYNSTPFANRIA